MDLKDVKKKIKIAKQAVKNEKDDQFKIPAFQVILSKLLDSESVKNEKKSSNSSTSQIQKADKSLNIKKGKEELAKKCGVSVVALEDVLYLRDGSMKVVAPLSGTASEKHITISKCILTAYQIVFNQTWVQASTLSKCAKMSRIEQIDHLSRSLKKDEKSFRTQGNRGGMKYKITEFGKTSTYEIIRKLVKAE